MATIHTRIRERRLALNLSHQGLADILGVKRQTVQQWETEPDPANEKVLSTAPKRSRLADVAKALGVTEEWLLTGRGAPVENAIVMDPIEHQLLGFYRGLTPELQEALVQHANALHTAVDPTKRGPGNPFGGKRAPVPSSEE